MSAGFFRVMLIVSLSLLFPHPGHTASYNDTNTLLDDLFSAYKTDTRPLLNQSQTLEVNFTLMLTSTIVIDVPNQVDLTV